MTSIGPQSSPSALLAQSLQQAAHRSGSAALADFAAQIGARAGAKATVAAPAQEAAVAASSQVATSTGAASGPDQASGLRRPGSVLDIRV